MRIPTVTGLAVPLVMAAMVAACEAPDWRLEGERETPAPVVAGPIHPNAKAGEVPAGPSGAGDPGSRALVPIGTPARLAVEADANLQWAASVVELVPIEDQNAKVFATAGGDPAVNGLYSYVAFFAGPAEGWRVYRLGDFQAFEVMAIARGRIDLSITEDTVSQSSGEIVRATRRAIVAWTPGIGGAPPAEVTMTPAR